MLNVRAPTERNVIFAAPDVNFAAAVADTGAKGMTGAFDKAVPGVAAIRILLGAAVGEETGAAEVAGRFVGAVPGTSALGEVV